ncbi:MAG: diaminopimelate decarboxylase [Candidatus Aminicenantes bacterium RBG_13_59_9]|nr:MAG: diaminopimelate decarboxylase [Candidatus Aminicenantes bacterium RBG_13_59_9]
MWWENNFLRNTQGRLHLAGRPASAVAAERGTPLYVYGRDAILSNTRALRDAFAVGDTDRRLRICYALKANSHPGILKLLENEGTWVDAVSPGEVEAALDAGFPPGRILFTGTSVSREDFRRLLAHPGLTINVDAVEQLDLLAEVRLRRFPRRPVRLSVRWNPGLGRGFNPKVVTAGRQTPDGTPIKFGVEDSRVLEAFRKAASLGFQPVGLHQHLGSGWVKEDLPTVKAAVLKMLAKAQELERSGFRLEFLDFGGGFGPKYAPGQKLFPLRNYAAFLARSLKRSRLTAPLLLVEPGKYLVGEAGVLLLRVEYVKRNYGFVFACVNCGTFNSVPRPAIYLQATHAILNCDRLDASPRSRVTVAGNLCETGDVFGKNVLMPLPRPGDILAVLGAGAYCRSMASHFNLRPIPREILL